MLQKRRKPIYRSRADGSHLMAEYEAGDTGGFMVESRHVIYFFQLH